MNQLIVLPLLFLGTLCQIGDIDIPESSPDDLKHPSDNSSSGSCDHSCQMWCIYIAVILIVLGVLCFIVGQLVKHYLDKRNKKQLFQKFMNSNTCQNELQLQEVMEKVQSGKWNMEYNQNEKQVKVAIVNLEMNIVEQNETIKNPYLNLKIQTNESLGQSLMEGAIIFSKDLFKIFMFKNYKNKQKAKQVKDCSILVYEGSTKKIENGFSGKWYHFYNKPSTGTWTWKK